MSSPAHDSLVRPAQTPLVSSIQESTRLSTTSESRASFQRHAHASVASQSSSQRPLPSSTTALPELSTFLPREATSHDEFDTICATGEDFARQLSHGIERGHGPLNWDKALKTGGLCFAPVYNEFDNAQRHTKNRFAFGLMSVGLQALTGAITGIAAYAVAGLSEHLGNFRLRVTLNLLSDHTWFSAWLCYFGIMLGLALLGALPVVFYANSAGSSGIPSIIGILNGCDLCADFTWRTLLVRLMGVTCAVASGLAVGPEGPMIFIGACTGALLSRIPSQPAVWRYLGRPPSSLNQHVYLRDYVSTGAACGIAAAFRAPIAGTLFVVEEAASHFRREHLAKIFLGGIAAMLAATYLAGEEGILELPVTTGANCRTWQWLKATNYMFFAIVGVVCGLAGALFNHINVLVNVFRARHLKEHPRRCIADIVCLCLVTSIFWVVLPVFIPDRSAGDPLIFARGTTCIKDTWVPQFIKGASIEGDVGLNIKYHPEPCFYGVQYDNNLCPQAYQLANSSGNQFARRCTEGLTQGTQIEVRADRQSYCCNFSTIHRLKAGIFQMPANASCWIDLGDGFPRLRSHDLASRAAAARQNDDPRHLQHNRTNHRHYNPMAALTLVSFDKAARNLFSRGAPYVMPAWVMLLFLPVFFVLAAVTAGSALPSGLLLPMIVIGALIGRLMAIALISIQFTLGWYGQMHPSDSMWSNTWQPFFSYAGGPLPDTVPLATTGWLDPGIGALIGAAAFLGGCSRISLMITVMMVEITGDPMMIGPVGVATLVAVIVGNKWNHGLYHSLIDLASFPFLPDRWPKEIPKALRVEHIIDSEAGVVCVPLMAQRLEVEQVLQCHSFTGFPVMDPDGVVVGLAMRNHLQQLLDMMTDTVDVGRVTDFHYVTIRSKLPLEVAYNLFKRMEISHMIVVDNDHRPVAVLTRGSLLPWHIEKSIGRRRMERVRSTIQRPRSFRPDCCNLDDTFWTEYAHDSFRPQADPDALDPQMSFTAEAASTTQSSSTSTSSESCEPHTECAAKG